MAKLITYSKGKKFHLYFIPGGPGLSSISFLPMMQFLKNDFNCHLIDPIGTGSDYGNNENESARSFAFLIKDLESVIAKDDNNIFIGHSFGGIQALSLAVNGQYRPKAVILMATPFSAETFKTVGENYLKYASPIAQKLGDDFYGSPTDETYKNWMANYGDLFFYILNAENGKQMILKDQLCVANYKGARGNIPESSMLLAQAKALGLSILALGGTSDLLTPTPFTFADAEKAGAKSIEIEQAAHFLHYDRPQPTAEIIRRYISELEDA